MGIVSGVPYTVADDEKTNALQLYLSITCHGSVLCSVRPMGFATHLEKVHGSANINFVVI